MFESTAWMIYAYVVVGNILTATFIMAFLLGCVLFFTVVVAGMENEKDVLRGAFIWGKRYLWLLIPCLFFGALYPDTEEIKLILGGATVLGIGSAAVNIEGANELPKNLIDAANTFLEGIAEEK